MARTYCLTGRGCGNFIAEAASELGLTTKTKRIQGGADALIGMIGLGVAKPGQLALITGSSHLQFGGYRTAPAHGGGMGGLCRYRSIQIVTLLKGGKLPQAQLSTGLNG